MPARGEQRVDERAAPLGLQQRRAAARRIDSRAGPARPAPGRPPRRRCPSARRAGRRRMIKPSSALEQQSASQKVARRGGDDLQRRDVDLELLGRRRHRVEERAPDGLRLAAVEALEHHRDRRGRCRGRKRICSPQCGLNSARAVEVDDLADQPAERRRPTPPGSSVFTAPKISGRACVRSVSRVTTPKLPPPPPLSAQNSSGCVQALAIRTAPSAVTTSASSRLAAASAVGLRKAAEAAALDQPGDADGHAAAALHVAAGLGRDRVVDLRPDRAGLDRDGAAAALRPRSPAATKASCSVIAFIRRVQTSSESARWTCPGSCGRRP